jgi:hypothetical protein
MRMGDIGEPEGPERGQTTSFKNLPDHSPFPAFHFEFVSNLRPVSLLSARSTL